MRDLAGKALEAAVAAGATYADARASMEQTESVTVQGDRVEGVERGTSRGLGVRVLAGGAWGFAATARLDRGSVVEAARTAVAVAGASVAAGHHPVELAPADPVRATWVTPFVRDPLSVDLGEKLDLLLATTRAAARVDGLAYTRASTDAWKTATWLRSTEGTDVHQVVVQVAGGLECVAVGGGDLQVRSYPNGLGGDAGSGGWEAITGLAMPEHAEACAAEAVALLTAPPLPSQHGTLILDGSQLGMQVHESVGHPLELDRILGWEAAYAGGSFLSPADAGVRRYGSPLVNLTLDSTTPGAPGTFGYDDEGTPATRRPLVSEGVLTGFLTSRETAAALGSGARSNGTVRADSWGSLPLIRMSNIHLEPGEGTLDDLLADTGRGVLMATNRSWSIDDRRVNFHFGCEAAWEVRNGRRGRLYRNPTYTGRTVDFWSACDAVTGPSEWRVWGTLNCDKGQPSQVARVGHGTAPARFQGVEMGAP